MSQINAYMRIRNSISKVCQKNDHIYYFLRRLNRFLLFSLGGIINWFRSKKNQTLTLDINRILLVNPKDIINCSRTDKIKYFEFGSVADGEWDLNTEPFSHYNDILSSLKDILLFGKPYKLTKYYQNSIKKIENGEIVASCRNIDEFDCYIKRIMDLYEDIKINGYRRQEDITNGINSIDKSDYVTINIDRNGHFLFTDGQHRLAIAKILNIPSIPVRVAMRHTQWVNLRKNILDISVESGGKIYQSIPHPDLNDIPAYHDDERWSMISSNLPFKSGTVLDIGAHWGYFCHKFEEIGFSSYAVENDPVHLFFLKKIKIANHDNFQIIPTSIFNLKDKVDFDVVLGLNIFHHFLKTKEVYDNFIQLLKTLKIRSLFFEPHQYEEFVGKGYYKNLNSDDFLNLITTYSSVREVSVIGQAPDNRKIYRIDSN